MSDASFLGRVDALHLVRRKDLVIWSSKRGWLRHELEDNVLAPANSDPCSVKPNVRGVEQGIGQELVDGASAVVVNPSVRRSLEVVTA